MNAASIGVIVSILSLHLVGGDTLVATGGPWQGASAGPPYDSAKRLYQQACREPRFRALLILHEGRARQVEDRDRQWMASAEALNLNWHFHPSEQINTALGGMSGGGVYRVFEGNPIESS